MGGFNAFAVDIRRYFTAMPRAEYNLRIAVHAQFIGQMKTTPAGYKNMYEFLKEYTGQDPPADLNSMLSAYKQGKGDSTAAIMLFYVAKTHPDYQSLADDIQKGFLGSKELLKTVKIRDPQAPGAHNPRKTSSLKKSPDRTIENVQNQAELTEPSPDVPTLGEDQDTTQKRDPDLEQDEQNTSPEFHDSLPSETEGVRTGPETLEDDDAQRSNLISYGQTQQRGQKPSISEQPINEEKTGFSESEPHKINDYAVSGDLGPISLDAASKNSIRIKCRSHSGISEKTFSMRLDDAGDQLAADNTLPILGLIHVSPFYDETGYGLSFKKVTLRVSKHGNETDYRLNTNDYYDSKRLENGVEVESQGGIPHGWSWEAISGALSGRYALRNEPLFFLAKNEAQQELSVELSGNTRDGSLVKDDGTPLPPRNKAVIIQSLLAQRLLPDNEDVTGERILCKQTYELSKNARSETDGSN